MKPEFVFRFILLPPQFGDNSSNRFQVRDTCFSLSTLHPAVWVVMTVLFKILQQELKLVLVY